MILRTEACNLFVPAIHVLKPDLHWLVIFTKWERCFSASTVASRGERRRWERWGRWRHATPQPGYCAQLAAAQFRGFWLVPDGQQACGKRAVRAKGWQWPAAMGWRGGSIFQRQPAGRWGPHVLLCNLALVKQACMDKAACTGAIIRWVFAAFLFQARREVPCSHACSCDDTALSD